MIKVYAFDFDGVISDSSKGWAFFCRKAWIKMGNKSISVREIEKYRPYVKNVEESFGLLFLLSKHSKITREKVKVVVIKNQEKADEFKGFFNKEKISIEKDKLAKLYGPYKFAKYFLESLGKPIYIVTSNKKEAIWPTIQLYNLPIKESNIIDNSFSNDKKEHIKEICRREKIKPEDIVFVEDSIVHLKDVISTKVQAYLASWGFVLKEDLKEAQKLGIKILDKNNLGDIKKEYFDVINEEDKIIGKASRDECHKKGLLHRAVHIFLLNSNGELLLQKRSMKKDLYPGWWIDATAGHVNSGETYDKAAEREMMEEIGISAKLEKLLDVKRKWIGGGKNDNELIRVYLCHSDGPFKICKEEIDFVRFVKPKDVLRMMKTEKFTPGTVAAFEGVKKHPDILKRLGLD